MIILVASFVDGFLVKSGIFMGFSSARIAGGLMSEFDDLIDELTLKSVTSCRSPQWAMASLVLGVLGRALP